MTESLAMRLDLNYDRIDGNGISIDLSGRRSRYMLTVILRQECDMICFSADLDLCVSEKKYFAVADAILKANERVWIGHFDYVENDNRIIYGFTIPFISIFLIDEAVIKSTIDLIIGECDRFYHYFLLTIESCDLLDLPTNTLFLDSVGKA
jgi:hypothetical protein